MNIEDAIKQITVNCDNYIQTVQALKALANELLWDDDKRCLASEGVSYIGRKMDTSPANRISPNNQVTPDLVVLRSDELNYVVEAKLALSEDSNKRKPKLIELQKYDDDLLGWKLNNGSVSNHDIILLVHFFHGKNVQDQINQLKANNELSFKKNFSLFTFHRVDETQIWMCLELLDGSLSDVEKERKIKRRDKPISLEHIIGNPQFGHIQLYDHPPPLPLLMDRIHETILGELSPEDNLQLIETGEVEQKIDISNLREILAESFGPGASNVRTPEIPKKAWISSAMQFFVKLNWAKHTSKNKYIRVLFFKFSN